MTVFENMTQEENDFLERMKSAPPEQIASFRAALNQLMTCYGEQPTCSILATHINRATGEISTSGINLMPEEMVHVARMTVDVIVANTQPAAGETEQ